MSESTSRRVRRTGPQFRPVAVLSLFYFAGFFFVFAMLLVMPELAEVLRSTPQGPEQQMAAEELVRAAFPPRIPLAAGLAVLATGGAIWCKALPGLR